MQFLFIQVKDSRNLLAEVSLQFTPRVSLIEPSGLFLEISQTTHLFKGKLLALLQSAFEKLGGRPLTGVIAEKPQWALALASSRARPEFPSFNHTVFQKLPLHSLEWVGPPDTLQETHKEKQHLILFLRRLGFSTIRDFLKLPEESVHKRFGKLGHDLFRWSSGTLDFPLPWFLPEDAIEEKIDAEDISSLDPLLQAMQASLARIEARLLGRKMAVQKLRLDFHLESGKTLTREFALSEPLSNAKALTRLLGDFLENFAWDAPLRTLAIKVTAMVPHLEGQLSLWDTHETRSAELSEYVLRLQARYGASNVGVAVPKSSYLPETSWSLQWPPPKSTEAPKFPESQAIRPLFVFDPPRPCHPTKDWALYPLEKIRSDWWSGIPERVYFLAISPERERLWIYWTQNQWFLQGIYD